MRVAIVHDDLVQWGGAERVLEAICQIYPDAPIFTSVYDSSNIEINKRFKDKKITTSFLQKIPGWKSMYKTLLPLYGIAFEQFDFSDYDLVISHTTRFAKSIITKPETTHICYCHTPPRFLWHFSGEINFAVANILMSKLRIYDQVSAKRVDYFLAGSENAKKRIKKIYKVDSKVVYPFVDLNRFKGVESFNGGYFLIISRLNKYKRVDLAVEACLKLEVPLKVIGNGPELDRLKEISRNQGKIEFLGNLSDEKVIQVLSGCKALIVSGIEDFGLTPLEAQGLGKPVIVYREGGVMETVIEGKTGIFFDEQSVPSLMDAINRFEKFKFKTDDLVSNAARFSKVNFIKNFEQVVSTLLY